MFFLARRILICQSFIKVNQALCVKLCERHSCHTASAVNDAILNETKAIPNETKNVPRTNMYTTRSHTCGELRVADVNKHVVVCGWLQYQRVDMFAILRDGYGQLQVIIPPDRIDMKEILSQTPLESVIQIKGTVARRPEEQIKNTMSTGEIEVIASDISILNKADTNIPVLIRNFHKAKEDVRLKHRYLDFRFPEMQQNLRFRSKFLMKAREFLINQRDFVEVETPTLFKRTPGGAREFVVPTHEKDKFYSLVQSPQQLKQLLMVGSVDRYFQVARCYRDESTRPDRQPEFTQLDIELSFTTRHCVMQLIEQLLCYCINIPSRPFPKMTYGDAMQLYGSDKPDLRYECQIKNLNKHLPEDFKPVDIVHRVLILSDYSTQFSNKTVSEFQALAKKSYPNVKVTAAPIGSIHKLDKILPQMKWADFIQEEKLNEDDVVVMAWGNEQGVLSLLGDIRTDIHRPAMCERNTQPLAYDDATSFNMCWITDFPLFLPTEDGSLESAHHPFTQPHPDDLDLLESNPLQVRGLHYDLVLNGNEIGGGSIRIHNSELQESILKLLNIDTSSLQHMIQAFKYGCPPHGGIALGIDRLMSILCRTQTIRDVIAFPKGFGGKDHLSGAPCDISNEEKKYYFLNQKDIS